MNLFNIDFDEIKPYVISAFTQVYGEEYHSIIEKRINNTFIVHYNDVDGLCDYIRYLRDCKCREYTIRFLDEIGIDTKEYDKSNYSKQFSDEMKKVIECFISSYWIGFNAKNGTLIDDRFIPIKSFSNDRINDEKKEFFENRLKIINYLRGNISEQITEENFEVFSQSEEYTKLLDKILKISDVYERLLSEYQEWEKQLLPYEKYISDEKKRKENIFKVKKREMWKKILGKFSFVDKNYQLSKSYENLLNSLCNLDENVSDKLNVEFFSHDDMEMLESSNTNIYKKKYIIICQKLYLKCFDIGEQDDSIFNCNSIDDINKYLTFLKKDNIKAIIPNDEMIKDIQAIKKQKYEEGIKEYYTTRRDFKKWLNKIGNNTSNFNIIYDGVKNNLICIINGTTSHNGNDYSFMFYTIRNADGGMLLHVFLHECGHTIDNSPRGCGFEELEICNKYANPYDSNYRKYERFNESINDFFTKEVDDTLYSQGLYFIESQEIIRDPSNYNTNLITRNLLIPLLKKFRKQVINAKIKVDHTELTKYIGNDNFEELVDVINKVDYLARNGVGEKIESKIDDEMVREYNKQVERIKQIYVNIDTYYDSYLEKLASTSRAVNNPDIVKRRKLHKHM